MIPPTETQYHYSVIARAIKVIDDAGGRELSLDHLAGSLGMSAPHFQRVFSRWAGVSPKRYQQYLALGHARDLLRSRSTVFETSAAVGLSSQGRLHDLLVRWEAMSPGEYARSGEGLRISWDWFDSPFGDLLAMGTDRGLCGLAFAADRGRDESFADLSARWPKARFARNSDAVGQWVNAALDQRGSVQLFLTGGPFHIKVWEALLEVPPGHVTTYSDLSRRAGAPSAHRAVGTAVGRNPVSWIIPCHRVLRKSGELGGYRWGLSVKRSILAWESARCDAMSGPNPG